MASIERTKEKALNPLHFDTLKSVGQWLLGEQLYSSSNWEAFVASHRESGTRARLIRLKKDAIIASAKSRIIASAERAAAFSHPNLVEVLDWGVDSDQAFVVTNSQGRSLADYVEHSGPLNETDTLTFSYRQQRVCGICTSKAWCTKSSIPMPL